MIDPRALRANIERLHAENPQGAVVIQADKASQTNTLVQVMDAEDSLTREMRVTARAELLLRERTGVRVEIHPSHARSGR